MFDEWIDRRGTHSVKWEESVYETQSQDVISLSVAEMDFRAPNEVINQLMEFSRHGIYSYTTLNENYYKTVKNWMKDSYDWEVREEWIVYCPRIIQAISLVIQNFTEKDDAILIQTPLYSPLKQAIELNDREVVTNPLIYTASGYKVNYEDLEEKLSNGVKIMILCSPHNPVGKVWDVRELTRIAELCVRYHTLLISDEVHADFTFDKVHTPVCKVSDVLENVMICTSPAKTFNLPGIEVSNIIIPNTNLREKFQKVLAQVGILNPTYYAVPALEQAYSYGDKWLLMVKDYIMRNYDFIKGYIEDYLPQCQVMPLEGTFLMWIDCRNLGLTESGLKEWFLREAKVSVSFGSSFGTDGEGFIRLNIATPRKLLEQAMNRILKTYPKAI